MIDTVNFGPPKTTGKFVTQICAEHSLIKISMTEPATPEEVNALRAGEIAESACRRIVWDFKQDGIGDLSKSDMEKFAKFVPDVPEGNRLAFVVPNELSFGISRMVSTHMELSGNPTRIRQFYDMDEALIWLISGD